VLRPPVRKKMHRGVRLGAAYEQKSCEHRRY